MLALAEEAYPLSAPQPGWSEQEPEDWWRATQACLARLPEGPVGFSGQMHGLVTLDETNRPLRPAILWNDQRTADECAEIEERIGLARLIELTGNRALTGFTAPKLLWLRTHEPEVYDRIAHILLPKDYVRLRLEGEHAIDAADASGTLLFDVAHRRWSDEVLAALEIPREWLPPSYESTEIAGAGDQAAGALGVGIDEPGPLSVVLGTSGVVFGVLPGYSADPGAFAHVLPRRSRNLACDGCDAGGSGLVALAAQRRRHGRGHAARRGGERGSRAPKDCCSSRTSPASGRHTQIRRARARSRGSPRGTIAAR